MTAAPSSCWEARNARASCLAFDRRILLHPCRSVGAVSFMQIDRSTSPRPPTAPADNPTIEKVLEQNPHIDDVDQQRQHASMSFTIDQCCPRSQWFGELNNLNSATQSYQESGNGEEELAHWVETTSEFHCKWKTERALSNIQQRMVQTGQRESP